jgi:hypothetical protein
VPLLLLRAWQEMVAFKHNIEIAAGPERLPLKPERAGSKWPKTTLAALSDNAPPLSQNQLLALRDACSEHARQLLPGAHLPVTELNVVQYDQRGLESAASNVKVPLLPSTAAGELQLPSAAQRARVDAVLR